MYEVRDRFYCDCKGECVVSWEWICDVVRVWQWFCYHNCTLYQHSGSDLWWQVWGYEVSLGSWV